ncbi:hypothetical protein CANCADRAFT_143246 [Tortispora caseinolytica NRRL Y-17796]|uniref:Urea carboxylase n=1 Tax=Tortispora caseinolytica NRRL Y-17796 TaxID=767744 RepID=A0A1E4TDC0_9ASCO|nr:hypothetical protein CANCADRAFT_143246 [Tortispora caseinolytica NRRL Y-17796]
MSFSTLKTVLIANRGEIALRVINCCKAHGLKSIAIYSKEDSDSLHVSEADEAHLLPGTGSAAYLNTEAIIEIAKETKTDVVVPGYGFLSENAEFSAALASNGIGFAGPDADSIENFGLKHFARELAIKDNVPVVPGSNLIETEEEAVKFADSIGYPVILKATAGGGGMGLRVCFTSQELTENLSQIKSRGQTLFKNSGVFLEKYVQNGRHIEIQVFGNGAGDVIAVGERECSIQRRHQKVVEETPSPFISHPNYNNVQLREKMSKCAIDLLSSVKYKSAGTVEFLVDDDTAEFYFLEVNTRLQVEHGISELCYGVDLVYMMLLQADYELSSKSGIPADQLKSFIDIVPGKLIAEPKGHAIEVRVYSENPVKNFQPSPGVLHNVEFPATGKTSKGVVRIDHWISTGCKVSPYFDPLLAKVMVWAPTRDEAIALMTETLAATVIQGPPLNLEYLRQVIADPHFSSGNTLTSFLDKTFTFEPKMIEFLSNGAYTTVQDLPGRNTSNGGIPLAGPMDSLSFTTANSLVGNAFETAALEITFAGPSILFHSASIVSLCGGEFDVTIDDNEVPMWSTLSVAKGSKLRIGKASGKGCRAYLAIKGGLPGVAYYLGSKSCTPTLNLGGHQGRIILPGDCLDIVAQDPASETSVTYTLPTRCIPPLTEPGKVWTIRVIPGPHDTEEILSDEGRAIIYESDWVVNHNSNRGAMRLDGPKPKFSRTGGGDGGRHPSNILEYGYPNCGLSFTGDSAILFGVDGATLSGFICVAVPVESDWWKFGQAKPGDILRFTPTSRVAAIQLKQKRASWNNYIATLPSAENPKSFNDDAYSNVEVDGTSSIMYSRPAGNGLPFVEYRRCGESMILVDFGILEFDLLNNGRQYAMDLALQKLPESSKAKKAIYRVECLSGSLNVCFDPLKIDVREMLEQLMHIENDLPPSRELKIPSRIFHFPMVFDHSALRACIERYIKTQRPHAPYLPNNIEYLMKTSAIETFEEFKTFVIDQPQVVTAVSFLCALPLYVQVDPRKRFMCAKYNPARTFTPAGCLATGSLTNSIYSVDSPGGYQMWGMTLPGSCWNTFSRLEGFPAGQPWLMNLYDQIMFYEVTEEELNFLNEQLITGRYTIKYEETVFDFSAYADLVESTKEEVADLRARQNKACESVIALDAEDYALWEKEKEESKLSKSSEEGSLANNPNAIKVASPMNASVWKIQVKPGDKVTRDTVLMILEAMKMEIPVRCEDLKGEMTIAAVMSEEGDVVSSGDLLLIGLNE